MRLFEPQKNQDSSSMGQRVSLMSRTYTLSVAHTVKRICSISENIPHLRSAREIRRKPCVFGSALRGVSCCINLRLWLTQSTYRLAIRRARLFYVRQRILGVSYFSYSARDCCHPRYMQIPMNQTIDYCTSLCACFDPVEICQEHRLVTTDWVNAADV